MLIQMRLTRRRTCLLIGLVLIVLVTYWASGVFMGPPVPVPVPADLDQMDPIVAESIREAVESARGRKGNVTRRMTLGMVYEANGMLGLARTCYDEVALAQPKNAKAHYRIAHVEERSGDLEAAIRSAQRVVELEPSYVPARAQLGLWLLDDGRTEAAALLFSDVLSDDPDNEAALFGKVLLAIRSRQPETAAMLIRDHQLMDGSNANYARHLEILIQRQMGTAASRTTDDRTGEQTRPNWHDPWNDAVKVHQTGVSQLRTMAGAHMDAGEYDRAAALLKRARDAEPENSRILNTLATCYRKQGRIADAIDMLEKALKLDRDDYWTNLNTADILLAERGDDPDAPTAALKHARAASRVRPNSGEAWALVGRACQALRRFDDAIEAFRHAYEVDSRDASVLTQAALIAYQAGRLNEAEETFRRVCELDATAASPRIGLAMIAIDRGDAEQADALLSQARSLRHDHANLWEYAADQLAALRARRKEPVNE